MSGNRWMRLLLASLGVDAFLALLAQVDDVRGLSHGGHRVDGVLAVVGLGWIAVVAVTAVGAARGAIRDRRHRHHLDQVVAASASTSDDWIWESDTEHRLTYSSPGVEQVLGYRPEDLLGRSALTLVVASERDAAARRFAGALADGSGWERAELHWLHADGSPVLLEGRAAPLVDHKGRVVGFHGTRRPVSEAQLARRARAVVAERVDTAVREGALDVALQPIVDLQLGRLVGAEALARFRDGRGPDEWFADAAEAERVVDLDFLAFSCALRQLPLLGGRAYLSVNATPELLISGRLEQHLSSIADLPWERLVIEVTEHSRVADYDRLTGVLTQLREQGARLAIDDTGAGYASMRHVLELRPDIIKIDRSLISGISGDAAKRSIVSALVMLALDIRATITAEGVETPVELETLAMLGVDHAQGYLMGKPTLEAADWAEWPERTWLPTASAKPVAQQSRVSMTAPRQRS